MLLAVFATDEQWGELLEGCEQAAFKRVYNISMHQDVDGYVLLDKKGIDSLASLEKPVLMNAVIKTCKQLGTGKNVMRINGWSGFIKRTTWEVAGTVTDDTQRIFNVLGRSFIPVEDRPGLVAARSISMIVNEAYFALQEKVSTKQEIDTAMKLGTNYPYGPFEWSQKIGLRKIYELLAVLQDGGKRYMPAPLLKQEALL